MGRGGGWQWEVLQGGGKGIFSMERTIVGPRLNEPALLGPWYMTLASHQATDCSTTASNSDGAFSEEVQIDHQGGRTMVFPMGKG